MLINRNHHIYFLYLLAFSWQILTISNFLGSDTRSAFFELSQTRRSANSQSVQVVDAAGRTVQMASRPQKILVVGSGPHIILHLLYMFPEGRARLLGMEKRGKSASDFLNLVDPSFDSKIVLGSYPGTEEIARVNPDLVLLRGSAADKMSEAMAKINIPVIYLGLESPEQFYKDIAILGSILGNETRAKEIVSYYQSRIEFIQKRLVGISEANKPRVLLAMCVERGGRVAVQVPAASWIQTNQVRIAGGLPVWLEAAEKTSGWTIVNLEQIAQWNPDKVFIIIWYSLDAQKMLDSFRADSRWNALKALQNKELHAFPNDIYGWDSPEPRWILGLIWLASRIHPDRFKDVDMTSEIYQYFEQLYDMDKTEVSEKIMPAVHMNLR